MRLRKARLAEADLAAIAEYGFEHFGAEQALAYLDAIEHRLRQLLDHPRLGRADQHLDPRVRSLASGRHRIYYSIEDDVIVVRRILHMAMDAGRWLG